MQLIRGPIHNTSVSVLVDKKVKGVHLIPQNKENDFEQKEGSLK